MDGKVEHLRQLGSRQMAAYQNDKTQINQAIEDSKKRWKEAIAKDSLVWDYHVSDLKKWECEPARQYGVSSIPRTFMIRQGRQDRRRQPAGSQNR